MNSKHADRWEELRKVNPNLAMEYLRIYTTMDIAQKHFNNFKKECNDWLYNIYKLGVKENDIVLDCFAGSGTTLVAAEELGRQWIGVDIGDESIKTIQERFIRGTKPMGDYVSKRKAKQFSPSLFEEKESPMEDPPKKVEYQLYTVV